MALIRRFIDIQPLTLAVSSAARSKRDSRRSRPGVLAAMLADRATFLAAAAETRAGSAIGLAAAVEPDC
jgi:hypothetical protein